MTSDPPGLESATQGAAGKRFAFVTAGPFSGINENVLERLRLEFPQLEPDHLDVPQWVRRHPGTLAANLLYVVLQHGPRVLLDRTRLWGAFFRSAFMFRAVRAELRERIGSGDYAFSFQTQSLFDASHAETPHFVYTDHTELVNAYYPDAYRARPPSPRWLRRERQIYAHAQTVFTMSSHVSKSLREQYGLAAERVSCVRAGANIARGGSPREGDPDYASKRVLFVGRNWERKGGPDLVAAFQLVRQRDPGASLVIVGCSPELDLDAVEILGELSEERVSEQYSRAAVFCMPSLVEPFGIVFVEALTRGLPVVATTIGALPDIVQDGESGYLLAPHDVTGLADALTRLIGDPERCRRFGQRGRAVVEERYTWERAVGLIADRIRTVI